MGGLDGYSGLDESPQHEDFAITIRHPDYGVRNVTYFVVDGDAIIDGDVHFGPVEELLAYSVPADTNPEDDNDEDYLDRRALSYLPSSKSWPRGVWKYTYDSDDTETLLKTVVKQGILRWKQRAPYFTFVKVKKNARTKGIVTISAKPGSCHATVGFKGSDENMNLNLAQPGCGPNQATHEIGHSLGKSSSTVLAFARTHIAQGYFHEHQRPDREQTVHFNCAAMKPLCPEKASLPRGKTCCDGPFKNGCCKKISNFNVVTDVARKQIDATGSYDTKSVMHYVATAFAIPGKQTLVAARQGVEVPTQHNGVPSEEDITRLCKMYPTQCKKEAPKKKKTCFSAIEEEEIELEETEEDIL